jgi:hypothetical protein
MIAALARDGAAPRQTARSIHVMHRSKCGYAANPSPNSSPL